MMDKREMSMKVSKLQVKQLELRADMAESQAKLARVDLDIGRLNAEYYEGEANCAKMDERSMARLEERESQGQGCKAIANDGVHYITSARRGVKPVSTATK